MNKNRYDDLIAKRNKNYAKHEATLGLAKAISSLGMFSRSSSENQQMHASINATIQDFNENIFIKTPAATSDEAPYKGLG